MGSLSQLDDHRPGLISLCHFDAQDAFIVLLLPESLIDLLDNDMARVRKHKLDSLSQVPQERLQCIATFR
ncbi:hypothetical protein [Planctomyces sp. SH-PL14]|uniref:hypothetical protein n=1 Tax=Planctomyces sp. SH-PL14 TaxID=1632864 RepID=UPI0012E73207|nr:hypothetical protein [Planctomyces sp. SH-PL14]